MVMAQAFSASLARQAASIASRVFSHTHKMRRQCSYAACHGQAGTALRVYAPGGLRAMPPATLDEQNNPLTAAEEHANFTSASGFAVTAPNVDDNFLLKKPLPSSAGGFEHSGGAIYSGTSDPQYMAIRAWLSGTGTAGSGGCAP